MTYFEIANKIGYYVKGTGDRTWSQKITYPALRMTLVYVYYRHSTGEDINIHLYDEDNNQTVHVYYDCHWFSSRYEFNNRDKKLGFLIDDAPWNSAIAEQFIAWEELINKHEEMEKEAAKTAKEIREREENGYIKSLKDKWGKKNEE